MRRFSAVLVQGVIVSLVVWLVALPLVALRFHLVSPIGILLNIPLIPLTSLALLAAGLTLGLSAVWGPLGVPAAWVCAMCLIADRMRSCAGGRRGPGGTAFVPGAVVGLGARVLRGCSGWRPWPGRPLAGPALGLVHAPGRLARPGAGPERRSRPVPSTLEADVLAVGHGLAVVIQSPTAGRSCLRLRPDARPERRPPDHRPGALVARGAAHRRGHPQPRRRRPLQRPARPARPVLRRRGPGRPRLRPPRQPGRRPAPRRPSGRAASPSGRSPRATPGTAAGVRVSVLHPPAAWSPLDRRQRPQRRPRPRVRRPPRPPDRRPGASRPRRNWSAIRARPFDVLLAPHHGGRTANPAWLYRLGQPGLVVVSQRPPAPGTRDALAPLEAVGIPVLRTWREGAIRLRWTPGGVLAGDSGVRWGRAGLGEG